MTSMPDAEVLQAHIDYDLPSVLFAVRANWQYARHLSSAGLNYQDWAKRGCLRWLRSRGINRPTMSDLKFNLVRNDQNKYDGQVWLVAVSLRKGEEAMIKMYQGLDDGSTVH